MRGGFETNGSSRGAIAARTEARSSPSAARRRGLGKWWRCFEAILTAEVTQVPPLLDRIGDRDTVDGCGQRTETEGSIIPGRQTMLASARPSAGTSRTEDAGIDDESVHASSAAENASASSSVRSPIRRSSTERNGLAPARSSASVWCR